MSLYKLISVPLCTFVLSSCGSSQGEPLDVADVCKLIAAIDVTNIRNNEMADREFDRFALELQSVSVRQEVKEVFNLLIGADAKDTYQLYLEAGNAYKEDWSCEPMKQLLSIQ